MSEKNVR